MLASLLLLPLSAFVAAQSSLSTCECVVFSCSTGFSSVSTSLYSACSITSPCCRRVTPALITATVSSSTCNSQITRTSAGGNYLFCHSSSFCTTGTCFGAATTPTGLTFSGSSYTYLCPNGYYAYSVSTTSYDAVCSPTTSSPSVTATRTTTTTAAAAVATTGPSSGTTYSSVFTRVDSSLSPSACNVPSDCNYKCSASYVVTFSGTSVTLGARSVSGCTCFDIPTTQLSSTSLVDLSWSISGGLISGTARQSGNGINVVSTVSGVTCSAQYVCTADCDARFTITSATGTTTASPSPSAVANPVFERDLGTLTAQCNVPSDCMFKCSTSYSLSFSGNQAYMYPQGSYAGCSCYTLSASQNTASTAVDLTFTEALDAQGTRISAMSGTAKQAGSRIKVTTSSQGITCSADYVCTQNCGSRFTGAGERSALGYAPLLVGAAAYLF